jgi:O-antigen/teichoic acid export membrane protein
MRKKSFVDIFIVGSGNGINAVLGLLFFTMVARTLSIEDFGRYALLTSLLVSLSKIMDFGTNSLFVAKSITKPHDYINRLFSLKLVLFFATLVVATGTLFALNLVSSTIVGIFFIGTIGYGINILLFAYFQRLEDFVKAITLNFIPAIIKALFAVLIFFGVINISLTQAFMVFSFSILFSMLLIPLLPKAFLRPKVTYENVKSFFLETLPAGISQVIKEGWLAIANSIAKLTYTFTEVGIFSLANKIADIFTLISTSVFTVLLPTNAQRKKNKEAYDMKETGILSVGILVLALLGMIVANYLTVPIFGTKFEASLGLLNILILASAITAIHSFMDNYFFVEEKTVTLMKITVSKLIFFITSAFVLTNLYSLSGLAWATLLSAIFALVVTTSVIYRRS